MKFTPWIVSLIGISLSSAGDPNQDCSTEYTYGYEYLHFYSRNELEKGSLEAGVMFYMEFYVKTVSDALILLADSDEIHDGMIAYEIVIGGGTNSFSQIRLFPKDARATQQTQDIVSDLELRGFWIKVTYAGVVMVGKMGEGEPFVFWINNRGFFIKYFAFSSWNNVKGEWHFNCKERPDAGGNESEGNVTDVMKLRLDLLSFYVIKKSAPDSMAGGEKLDVETVLDATYFHLNEKPGELILYGIAYLKWTDERLTWDPAQYNGLKYLNLNPYLIWTPSIFVKNSLSLSSKRFLSLSLSGGVVVGHDGRVWWRVPFHSVTFCMLGYENWPFDSHSCYLHVGMDETAIGLKVVDVTTVKIAKSEWEVATQEWQDTIEPSSKVADSLILLNIRRRSPPYEFLFLMVFLGAVVLSFVSFFLHPYSPAKLFLNIGSIAVLMLLLLCLEDFVPTAIPSSPLLVHLYSWSLLVAFMPVVLNIALRYIPQDVILPKVLSNIFNSHFVETVFCLPGNMETQTNYSHLREHEERHFSAIRLAMLIERFVFFLYFTALLVPYLTFLYYIQIS